MKKKIFCCIGLLILTNITTYYFSYNYGNKIGVQSAKSEISKKLVSEYDKGFENGKDFGYNNGYSDGNSEGYSKGYDEGYDKGYSSGNSDGYDDGYDDGSLEGHSQGYEEGKEAGYDKGYNDANSNDYTQSYNNNQSYSYASSPVVYITLTGSKYHRITCSYLKNSAIEISLKQAKSRGYSACSKCRPDRIQ